LSGTTPQTYAMLNHGDYLDFNIGVSPGKRPGSLPLDINHTATRGWDLFRTAALATGAFPIGLAPRPIGRDVLDYATSLRVGRDLPGGGFAPIPPDPIIKDANPFDFIAVDGGTIDNEPLEIGRRLLSQGGPILPGGNDAERAIVLIAPFPNFVAMPPTSTKQRIVDILPMLSSTLVQQSRFKPDELAQAADDANFSRFLISPARDGNGSPEAKLYPIASGVMGGFGGFIDESFRRHDYLLGRRNAQAFLRYHLALPETHPFFKDVKDRAKWHVREGGPAKKGGIKSFTASPDAEQTAGLPIIPLCGGLEKEIVIGEDDVPKPDAIDQNALATLIEARVRKVVETLVTYDLSRILPNEWYTRVPRYFAKYYMTRVITKQAVAKVEDAIESVRKAFG
jgi:hypothetical protein